MKTMETEYQNMFDHQLLIVIESTLLIIMLYRCGILHVACWTNRRFIRI